MKYPSFSKKCDSLLCKYLSKEIFDELKDLKTSSGFTLEKAINSGVENLDSNIGVYAGDEESYSLFSPLFNPIIDEYHGFIKSNNHTSDFNPENLIAPSLGADEKYIISTRIRVGRNVKDFPLGAAISKIERLELEKKVFSALSLLDGELKGTYFPLLGMSEEVKNKLVKDHFLFKEGDRFMEAAGLNRNWPEGRGIYHNDKKTFLVWVNEEDQIRIISMQEGGNIKEVFTRLSSAINKLEQELDFSFNSHLGYISSCPTNLGTAMRASVHIKIPNLAKDIKKLEKITNKYNLEIRGTDGEHSQSKGGVYDISNKRRLGITEVDGVQDMYDGVVALIAAEKSLE
ncbi:Putative ATP:guanido phosphotransferase YacI [hydrothermal vent metagenome]|uniref:Putative ATP:guanido phosphotransferase YacI n=1 Tax=hydrothermal vent metagenome TaxID=652676 RepID=A0A1W1ECV1_9ZZZZ